MNGMPIEDAEAEAVILTAIIECGKEDAHGGPYGFLSGEPLSLIAKGIHEKMKRLGYKVGEINPDPNRPIQIKV